MDAPPPLKLWDPRTQYLDRSDMSDGRFFYIVGPHGTGKSTLARRLMQYVDQNVSMWYAFCGSEGSRAVTDGLLPSAYCQYRPVTKADIQRVARTCALERRRASQAGRPPRRMGILFDDCSKSQALNGEDFTMLIDNMRHLGCTIIMTVQYAKYVHPDARGQADFLFTMNVTMASARKLLYEEFFRENMGTPPGPGFATRDRGRFATYMERYAPGPGKCLVFSRAGPDVVTRFQWKRRYSALPLGDPAYIEKGQALDRARAATEADPEAEYEEELLALTSRK